MNANSILLVPFVFSSLLSGQAPEAPIVDTTKQLAITRMPGLQADGAGRLIGGGGDYRVRLRPAGITFEPALGDAVAATQQLTLRPLAMRRGATDVLDITRQPTPQQEQLVAQYRHADGVDERYAVGSDGVALSWHFAERPAGEGDLVVRYEVDTTLPPPQSTAAGLEFVLPGIGGVVIGSVTGIDATGTEAAGQLAYAAGIVEMSLPAAFVDNARYPLVLDPVIGTTQTTTPFSFVAREPDAAYDSTTQRFLVVYHVPISGSDADVRAQRTDVTGTPYGPSMLLPAAGVASPPRVANLPARDRFGVVWTQQSGFVNSVEFVALNAGNGAITHTHTIESGLGVNLFNDVDIGADTAAPVGGLRGFVVIYEDDVTDAIELERITFDALDSIVLYPSTAWVNSSGPFFTFYDQPAIARACGDDQKLLIVARRSAILGSTSAIVAGVVRSGSGLFSPTTTVASSSTVTCSRPDVGGRDGKWLVAWQEEDNSTSANSIAWRPVQLDAAGSALTLGTTRTVGSLLTPAWHPTIGFTPGRSWLGYRFRSFIPVSTSVRAVAVDSQSGELCNDVFSEVVTSTPEASIVVATMSSGGLTSGEDALAVFDEGGQIFGQQLRNHGTGGSYTNLGGGCGSAGVVSFSHEPGIGSSGLVCSVSSLPPTALFSIFNFSAPNTTLPCGSCAWLPFSVTMNTTVGGGSASVEFPIPCLPTLAGLQFDVQWTTIDFTQAPCPTFPGWVLSDRTRMTIGT